MDKLKKTVITAGLMGFLAGAALPSAQAAYAVIDSENIAQQIKTYTETAKIALSTAQQVTILAKEIASLPAATLNSYTSAVSSSVNNVNSAVRQFTVFTLTQGVDETVESYWHNRFPRFKGADPVISEDIFRQNNTFMSENRSQDNKATIRAYGQLMEQLNSSQQQLQGLLQENSRADGGLKAQQIANQIAGIEANIKHIELNMQALKVKHQVEKDEADITTRLNQDQLEEHNATEIKNYVASLDTSGTWKAVRNPWKENGASTIGW